MTMTTDETLERLALLAMDTRYDTGVVSRQFLAGLAALIRSLRDERDRFERNRDMWRGQCDRQARTIMALRGDLEEARARNIIGEA